jgi:SiaC family regulatory phosphoprotein
MKDLIIGSTKNLFYTPSVYFQAESGICELAGESYIEDAPTFYEPLIRWLENFKGSQLIFNFKLTYFNTSSSKCILNVVKSLRILQNKGVALEINWFYPEDNYDLLAEAEDFMEDVGLEFHLFPYSLDY